MISFIPFQIDCQLMWGFQWLNLMKSYNDSYLKKPAGMWILNTSTSWILSSVYSPKGSACLNRYFRSSLHADGASATIYVAYLADITFFAWQVSTRFLSACPLIYWFASHIMGSSSTGQRWGRFIWAYSAAYIFIGSLLFSNFYPFTWRETHSDRIPKLV